MSLPVKIFSILLVSVVISMGALAVGYQFGKATWIDDNLISSQIGEDQSQSTTNGLSADIPDDAFGLYSRNCANCHGAVGEGSLIAPALDHPDLRARLEDPDIKETIANGRIGTAMPAWKFRLTDSEINALTTLIRNWGELGTEQLSELDSQKPYGHGMRNCRGNNSMMGGCGPGMGGHRWQSP